LLVGENDGEGGPKKVKAAIRLKMRPRDNRGASNHPRNKLETVVLYAISPSGVEGGEKNQRRENSNIGQDTEGAHLGKD